MSLANTTWESRRKMTAAQLIEAMGDRHILHPDYKVKSHPAITMPNLAGRQPVIQAYDCGITGQWRNLLRMVA